MSKLIQQFTNITEDQKQNPLMYLFFLETLSWGFAFLFASNSTAVEATVLHAQTVATFGPELSLIWGFVAILVVFGSLAGIYFRKSWLGQAVSLGGFAVWLYAFILYLMGGYWLHLVAIATPNMLFWFWWFIFIQGYHRKHGA